MQMVQAAYTKFREKWDTSIGEVYSGLLDFDWEKLHTQKVDFSEYEPAKPLDLQICQIV